MTKSESFDLGTLDSRFQLILCDLWGCVHNGVAPFDGVLDRLRAWRSEGRCVVFLTNAPRPMASVIEQLETLGIGKDCYNSVTSSGDSALAYIAQHNADKSFGFIGHQKDRSVWEDEGLTLLPDVVADTIICCGFHDDRTNDLESYESELKEAVARGATMLCLNPDIFVIRGGKKELCAGAIAERYEELGGKAVYFGKPAAPIYDRAFDLAREATGRSFERKDTAAIGDNMATDLSGAAAYGLDFLFVANGIEAERIASEGESVIFDQLDGRPKHPDFNLLAVLDGLR